MAEIDGLKPEVTRSEGSPTGEPIKREGFVKRHCRRWWWLDILALVGIILVIVLPIIYVAIPKIAQKEVNKATLEVKVQNVYVPTPESVHLELVTNAHSESKYHPILDPFRAALFTFSESGTENPPFGYIDIPGQKVERDTTVVVNQTLKIEDMAQFTVYNLLVLGTETFKVGIKGKTGLKLGGLPKYNIDFSKVVTMKGLNKLSGFNITTFDLHIPPLSDGTVLTGKAFIPNPSVLTIEMGNLTLDLFSSGDKIGVATMPNLILRPGDHEYTMSATTDLGKVLNKVISSNGILSVDIIGNSSVSGGKVLPYFSKAIQSNTLHSKLNLASITRTSSR